MRATFPAHLILDLITFIFREVWLLLNIFKIIEWQ